MSLASLGFRLFKRSRPSQPLGEDELAAVRQRMVDEQIVRRGIRSARVVAAMRKVERHRFLPRRQWAAAYEDHPLPIGEGQTISQPYIVALMTEALALDGGEKVLEIGTGSGYQTAVLAELAADVYSVEILSPLSRSARSVLQSMGYRNVELRVGDGSLGWSEEAPFDAILVSAAPRRVPPCLLRQLREGGRLVIPVGALRQELEVHTRKEADFQVTRLAAVRFVPLVGGRGS